MNEVSGALSELSIAPDGSIALTVQGRDGSADVTIPADKAVDSIMALLQGIARASERPGRLYQMMLTPLGIGSEIVETDGLGPVPVVLLRLEHSTFLRCAIDPRHIRPLAQQLLQRADELEQRAAKQ
jgi:hypothetical protein